ncbi:MAG: argininosuccinate lyase, partial [Planctomycetes bacterium]|nr:argininosuccinate lyase [Planctomycetota bacterium]
MTALWAGRASGEVDPLFKRFNDSLPFDRRLVREDIEGSIAWARALKHAGVLDATELTRVTEGLEAV